MQERKAFAQTLDGTIIEESPLVVSPIVEEKEETRGLAIGSKAPPADAVSALAMPLATGSTTETVGLLTDQPDIRSPHDDVEMSDGASSLTAVDEVQHHLDQLDGPPPVDDLLVDHEMASSTDSLIVNSDYIAAHDNPTPAEANQYNPPPTPPPDRDAKSAQPPPIPPRPVVKDQATEQIEAWTEQQDVREVMENIVHQLRWAVRSEGKESDNEQIDAITR